MIKNTTGKTEFLRDLKYGQPAVWYCDGGKVEPTMRCFTAVLARMPQKFKIKQRKAMLVMDDVVPQAVIIIEKIKGDE